MQSIRIGKDIEVRWPILTNGQEIALEGRDLTLFARLPTWAEVRVNFTAEGNVAIFIIPGKEQTTTGTYSFTMWENYGKAGQTAVDYCQAFQLVDTTCMEGGEDKGLTTETLNLESSNIVMGLPGPKGEKGDNGLTAYELFKKYNPSSSITEKEYVNKPIDAAGKADTASANADQQAARAKSLADHPPKIVDVGGLKYWAFWDEATKDYVTSEYRAEGGAIMPVFWVDPATLKLYVTYQNGYEEAKFKLENGKLYTIKTINQ
jgi:hypothetical protein